jgi:hypothetical protein
MRGIRMSFFLIVGMALGLPQAFADPPQGSLGDRGVSVINRSKLNIQELYVSPQSADAWGQDQLGEAMLAQDQSVRLKLGRMRDCLFDMMAVYDDASQEEMRGVNVCRSREVAFTGAGAKKPPAPAGPERRVTLSNASPLPLQQVFISEPDAAQWGDDRLAQSAMSVGEQRVISFTGPCRADVRVVFSNRAAEERRNLDLCANPTLQITPGWTTADRTDTP